MPPRRNGKFYNPQPVLFIGLKDDPDQGLLFDSPAGFAEDWTDRQQEQSDRIAAIVTDQGRHR